MPSAVSASTTNRDRFSGDLDREHTVEQEVELIAGGALLREQRAQHARRLACADDEDVAQVLPAPPGGTEMVCTFVRGGEVSEPRW